MLERARCARAGRLAERRILRRARGRDHIAARTAQRDAALEPRHRHPRRRESPVAVGRSCGDLGAVGVRGLQGRKGICSSKPGGRRGVPLSRYFRNNTPGNPWQMALWSARLALRSALGQPQCRPQRALHQRGPRPVCPPQSVREASPRRAGLGRKRNRHRARSGEAVRSDGMRTRPPQERATKKSLSPEGASAPAHGRARRPPRSPGRRRATGFPPSR